VVRRGMKMSDVEVKVIFQTDDGTRVLRGKIDHEDDYFVYILRLDGIHRIGKKYIIKIEEGNNDKRLPS
jgi:hypothetical protein